MQRLAAHHTTGGVDERMNAEQMCIEEAFQLIHARLQIRQKQLEDQVTVSTPSTRLKSLSKSYICDVVTFNVKFIVTFRCCLPPVVHRHMSLMTWKKQSLLTVLSCSNRSNVSLSVCP